MESFAVNIPIESCDSIKLMRTAPSKEIKDWFIPRRDETDDYLQSLYTGENLAKSYAIYRPHYPKVVYDKILSYHDKVTTNGHQRAVDVCCGTGQSTMPLVKHFAKVVGVDVSEDQLSNMPKDIPGLTCCLANAEDMPMIETGTVDLVTIATGLHWVNTEKFYQEVKRILKPGGTFAAYTWLVDTMDDEIVNECMKKAVTIFHDYINSKFLVAIEKYQTIKFPFENLTSSQFKDEMTIEEFKGYMHSMHFVKLYYEANLILYVTDAPSMQKIIASYALSMV